MSTSESDVKIKQKTGGWISFGLFLIVFMLGSFSVWAVFASIGGAVIGQGVVTVEGQAKTIQHLQGGIIGKIYVRNGDHVKEGQLLIRLDDTVTKANMAITDGRLVEFYARKARLEAERDQADTITISGELAERQDEPEIARIIAGQRLLFQARKKSREGQIRLLRQKIDQYNDEIKGIEAQGKSKKKQAELIRKELETIMPLFKKGHITQRRLLALEREAVRLEGEYGKHLSDMARVHSTIGETELQILQIDTAIREKVLSEMREVQSQISELEERRLAIRSQLENIDIRAPTAGLVHNLAVHTVGGVIRAAAPIMQIIPEGVRLVIEAQISPTDVDQVHIGQDASIRFSAFSSRTTPTLDGKVTKISADRLVDKASGRSFFTVIVDVSDEELKRLGNKTLLPGMPAEVFVSTNLRSAMSYLLKPVTDQLNRAFRET
ncbi:MAG TPA: HlyD family type I secretion periplasmic adaptor subunit [Rhizobiales bacterium]|nr:HlyD family type I secretion periplasmic adaptor subunit [Hyphomicrobiales bacterium]